MGKQWKQWQILGSKITAVGDCSHEIKTLVPWKKSYDKPRSHIIRSRDITLPTKVCRVEAMISPIVTYGCESWIIKKAEWRRLNAFELWCWRRLLRVPWTARMSNQSILEKSNLNIHRKDAEAANTLATWWEELTHWERPWCWERLRARGKGGDRG